MVGLAAGLLGVAAGVALVMRWSGRAETPLIAPTASPAPPPSLPGTERRTNASARPAPTPMPTEAPSTSPVVPQPVVTPTMSATPSPSPAPAKAAEGSLLVVVTPWADVSIDGVPAGQTPLKALPLQPGPHAVLLTHPDYQPFPRRVTIRSGETFRLVVDLPTDGVRRSP